MVGNNSIIFEFSSSGYSGIIREFNDLGTAQKQLEQITNQLAKAFVAQGNDSKSAILAAKELAKANGLTADSIKQLNDRIAEQKARADAIATAVKEQIRQQNEAARAAKQQEDAVKSLGFTLKGNTDSFLSLGKAFDNNYVEANKAIQGYNQLRSSGASLKETQQTLASTLGVTESQFKTLNATVIQSKGNFTQAQQAIVAFGAGVSAAIGSAFANGAKQFAEFDFIIRQIGVTTESSGTPQLKALTEQIKSLSLATTKSPQEIAELSLELTKSGFSAEQASKSIGGIVKTSEATGESLTTVGQTIAKVINQFNLTANDSERVGNVITKVANSSAVSVQSLGLALNYVGTASAQSNQSIENTAAVLGVLGKAGLDGSTAGTGLTQVLTRLNVASATVPPELENVVKGSKKMREAFDLLNVGIRDSNNQLLPLPEVLSKLRNGLSNFDAGEKAILAKAVFGDQGGRAFLALMNQSDETLQKAFNDANNAQGTVQKSADELNKSLDVSFKQFNSSLQLLAQSLGENLAPALQGVLKGATDLINGFLNLDPNIQKLVFGVTGLGAVLVAAVTALTAYNLAVNAGLIASAQLALETVAGTVALVARTGATVTATTAQLAYNVATGNFAAVSATLAPALEGAGVALKGFLATLTAALPALIALGGAFAIFKTQEFMNGLIEANAALNESAKASQVSGNEFANLGAKVKSLNDVYKENGKFTEEQKKQAQGLLAVSKQKIESLEAEKKAAETIKPVNEEQANAQKANIAGINTQINALQNQNKQLEENITKTEQHTSREKEATVSKGDLRKATRDLTDDLKEQAKAEKELAEEKFKDQEKGIKRKEDDQKEGRKEAFEDKTSKIQEESQEKIQGIREKQEEVIKGIQEKNSEVLENRKKDFEQNTIEPLKLRQEQAVANLQASFNREQSVEKKALEDEIHKEEKAFTNQQNIEKKAFERGLRDEQREFELKLAREKREFDKQANEEKRKIDLQLELTDPKNAGRAGELVQEFANEERKAKLRETLEAPLRAKQEAFEEKQRKEKEIQDETQAKKKEAEENKLNAAKASFEDGLNNKKIALEDELNKKKIDFENNTIKPLKIAQENEVNNTKRIFENTVIRPLKLAQETELLQIKKTNESVLKQEKIKTEEEIKNLKRAFQKEELAIDRKNEDEKTARERAFKAEERVKDEALANKIKAIKDSSGDKEIAASKTMDQAASKLLEAANKMPRTITNTVPGRKDGGSVSSGSAYIVGENEPELFIPNVSGTILNQQQIRQNLDLFHKTIDYRVPLIPGLGESSSDFNIPENQEVVNELRSLKQIISNRNPTVNVPITVNGESKDQISEFIQLQRNLLRGTV